MKAALNIFGLASGLFSNLDKRIATPIHCTDLDIARVQNVLSCRIEEFPCHYLGVPLSVYKLKWSEEQPLVDKVAGHIPGWKGKLLNAIPIHTSIALCLSPWAIKAIDKLRRGFIWVGSESVMGGRCKVAWETVYKPRELGSLGISDLRRTGVALRVHWVWKDHREGQVPRTKERAVLAMFEAATVFTLGNGESTFFWTDRWLNGASIQSLAPTVFCGGEHKEEEGDGRRCHQR